jgi:small subunit ribosomal protein S14
MVKFFKKDFQLRLQVKNFELYHKILKSILLNSELSSCIRRELAWQYSRLGFCYSFSFLKNQCILSGRKRSVYCDFNLSRLAIKSLFKSYYIPYLQKSSW